MGLCWCGGGPFPAMGVGDLWCGGGPFPTMGVGGLWFVSRVDPWRAGTSPSEVYPAGRL